MTVTPAIENRQTCGLPSGGGFRGERASAKTTLGTYEHSWPDCDEPTRAIIEAVSSSHANRGGTEQVSCDSAPGQRR